MHFFTQPGLGPAKKGKTKKKQPLLDKFHGEVDSNCGLMLDNKYHLGSLIGEGGIGRIYAATDLGDKSLVVVKIQVEKTFKKVCKKRITQEIEALQSLKHPNIVTLKDSGIFRNGDLREMAYEVMELMVGANLQEYLGRKRILSWRAVREITSQACAGLGALHQNGILHRDVKPENIFLTEDNVVKVYDFDLSKFCNLEQNDEEDPNTFFGTAHYVSPERVCGMIADHRADIFSLGVVMFNMLFGSHPFMGETPEEVVQNIVDYEIVLPDITGTLPGTPKAVEHVVRKALQYDPDKRFQTMQEMRKAILNIEDKGFFFGHDSLGEQLRIHEHPWLLHTLNTMDIIPQLTMEVLPIHEQVTQEIMP
jgi:serine/threonine-protein kinase